MKVVSIHLADAAVFDGRGKPSLVGIFRAALVRRLPTKLAPFYLALEVEVSDEEIGSPILLGVEFSDPAGALITRLDTEVLVNGSRADKQEAHSWLIIQLTELRIERPGDHEISLLVNSEKVKSHPLSVLLLGSAADDRGKAS